jgi:uncharacterized protein (TIGR00369 family)
VTDVEQYIPVGPDGVPFDEAMLTNTELLTCRMGIRVTDWNPKHMVGTMPVSGNKQQFGFLHGGASAALAETLGSIAAAIYAGPTGVALGQELSCTHHRPARTSQVIGVCEPVHLGSAVATYEIVISDELGNRVCTARLTCVLRRRPVRPAPRVPVGAVNGKPESAN